MVFRRVGRSPGVRDDPGLANYDWPDTFILPVSHFILVLPFSLGEATLDILNIDPGSIIQTSCIH